MFVIPTSTFTCKRQIIFCIVRTHEQSARCFPFQRYFRNRENVDILQELRHLRHKNKWPKGNGIQPWEGVWNRVCCTLGSCFGPRLPKYHREQNCLRRLLAWTGTRLSTLFERKKLKSKIVLNFCVLQGLLVPGQACMCLSEAYVPALGTSSHHWSRLFSS